MYCKRAVYLSTLWERKEEIRYHHSYVNKSIDNISVPFWPVLSRVERFFLLFLRWINVKKNLICTYIHIFVLIWTFFFSLSLSLSFHSFIHKQERNCLSPSNKQQRSSNNVDDRRKKNCLTHIHTRTEKKEEEEERVMC